mgnify:CR=1 FL=1
MALLVSPCCGDQEYTDTIDEYENDVFMCSICNELFIEPIEDYEYDARMRESIAEARADEKRDLGL